MTGNLPVEIEDGYIKELSFYNLARNWKCFITITLLASGLEALLELIYTFVTTGSLDIGHITLDEATEVYLDHYYVIDTDGSKHMRFSSNLSNKHPGAIAMIVVNTVIVYVTVCLAKGAVIQVVSEMYASTGAHQSLSPSVMGTYGSAARKGMPLVGACLFISTIHFLKAALIVCLSWPFRSNARIQTAVIVGPGTLLGVIVAASIYLMIPTIMVENRGVIGSLQRSLHLLKGNAWTIFSVVVVYGFVQSAVTAFVFWLWSWSSVFGQSWAAWVLIYFTNAVFLAMGPMIASVVYFNIRVKEEQLSAAKLAVELGLVTSDDYTNMNSGNSNAIHIREGVLV